MSSVLVTGRFAPSPTGAQHVGNARTFLIAWLSARSQGGRVLLRIEDIDTWRNKPGAVEQALSDLRWLGLDWDGDAMFQLPRLAVYREALSRLQAENRVYPCTCSRSDILQAASAPHLGESSMPVYPGTCASRSPADAQTLARPFAWRFRVAESPSFADGFWGNVSIDLSREGGDFVIWRNDDMPAYQLAVVVDDAAQGVTEVVRGDDLLSSTPRQLLLYQALGLTPPRFIHVPLVVGPDGKRLAKRHGDTRLSQLREQGVAAESLVGLLAWSCGWQDRPRPISARELLPCFDLNAIPKVPFVLEREHLRGIGYSC
jgi:glutamyl-tRNA synthetase